MAKAAMVHSHRMQERDLTRRIQGQWCRQIERWAGQTYGFVVSLTAIGGSVYVAMNDHETVAAILGGTTVVALATVFILGRLYNPRESATEETRSTDSK